MLIGIEGFLGDGKTVLLVRYLKKDFLNGKKIYANFTLHTINYEYLDIRNFLNKDSADKYKNCTIGIDEITLCMDCRRSSKKENIAVSTLARQSRKRSLDVYYTAQSFDELDFRLIRYTSIFVIAERVYTEIKDNSGNIKIVEVGNLRQYTVIDCRKKEENVTRFTMDITKFFDDYDTDEIIESIYEDKPKSK